MKKLVLISGTVVLAVVGIWGGISIYNKLTAEPLSDEEQLIKIITSEYPSFTSNEEPLIEIESVSDNYKGWYVVTIKSKRPVKNFVPVKLVMLETGGIAKTILGPDTHFTESDLLKYNVPDSVIMELQKS